jgi:hypothetical protein
LTLNSLQFTQFWGGFAAPYPPLRAFRPITR